MADVTGPISTLPGARRSAPAGATCDDHPDRPALVRIQGETDSFGCEMIDLCQECLDKQQAYLASDQHIKDNTQPCDWCKTTAFLSAYRDSDEGSSGPVYRVCRPCRKTAIIDAHQHGEDHQHNEPAFTLPSAVAPG